MKKEKKPKKLRTKIAEGISLGLLILAVILMVVSVVSATTGNPANIFGYSLSYVPTNSMETTIHQDSFIVIKKAKYEDAKIDDIIVYRAKTGQVKGLLVVHRIVDITEEGYITQGDNNPAPDSDPITEDMFYGKFVRVVYSGDIGLKFNSNIIFVVLVGMFLIIIIAQVVNVSIASSKLKDEKKDKMEHDLALEQMKKEIYEEELAKLKAKNSNKDETK